MERSFGFLQNPCAGDLGTHQGSRASLPAYPSSFMPLPPVEQIHQGRFAPASWFTSLTHVPVRKPQRDTRTAPRFGNVRYAWFWRASIRLFRSGGVRPPTEAMIAFIDDHPRGPWGRADLHTPADRPFHLSCLCRDLEGLRLCGFRRQRR